MNRFTPPIKPGPYLASRLDRSKRSFHQVATWGTAATFLQKRESKKRLEAGTRCCVLTGVEVHHTTIITILTDNLVPQKPRSIDRSHAVVDSRLTSRLWAILAHRIPRISMRCALCTSRSRMPSRALGSPSVRATGNGNCEVSRGARFRKWRFAAMPRSALARRLYF